MWRSKICYSISSDFSSIVAGHPYLDKHSEQVYWSSVFPSIFHPTPVQTQEQTQLQPEKQQLKTNSWGSDNQECQQDFSGKRQQKIRSFAKNQTGFGLHMTRLVND